jgi:hypothetical protein
MLAPVMMHRVLHQGNCGLVVHLDHQPAHS